MRDRWYERANPEYLVYLNSKAWKDRRALVFKRCADTCERCGKFAVTEVHHLTYSRIFREELEDLQGVCDYCHDFLHRKRPDDGAAEHARQERQQGEMRAKVEKGRSELRRLDEHPHLYRTFTAGPVPNDKEWMRLLRQHPRVVGACGVMQITRVRSVKRRRGATVAFRIEWEETGGRGWMMVADAGEWVRRGVVFDTERWLWVDAENIRWFVGRNQGE